VRERVVGTWIDDEMIGSRVRSKLLARPGIRAGEIDSSSSQGIVTLIGRVGSTAIRDEAERIARSTPGVKGVRNHLLVGRTRS
jgi:osmotically-inducible protein OsmY